MSGVQVHPPLSNSRLPVASAVWVVPAVRAGGGVGGVGAPQPDLSEKTIFEL
jgi:hypothetical protein